LLDVQFGKHIQSHQVPGWNAYYLDYKFLKKIISSLASNKPASDAATLAAGIKPLDVSVPDVVLHDSSNPPIFAASEQDEERGASYQAHKAAFFFKLERELEKVWRCASHVTSL
jgi:CDK inhibitor PHO81